MKAAVVTAIGVAPVYTEHPDPEARGDLIAVPVRAASVKNLDRGMVAGEHYDRTQRVPFVPGFDGVVELPGGELAFAHAAGPCGLLAELTLVDPSRVLPLPTGTDPVVAAALVNPGVSAWVAVEVTGRVQPGQTVLVLGATGVTGSLAVQLALGRFGAGRVIAAGRDRARLELLKSWGAEVLDLDGTPAELQARIAAIHAASHIDVVIDYLWGAPAEATFAAIAGHDLTASARTIRYVEVGTMAGPDITLPGGILRGTAIELVGQGGGSFDEATVRRIPTEILPELLELATAGTLHLDIERRPLAEIGEAWPRTEPSGTRRVLVP